MKRPIRRTENLAQRGFSMIELLVVTAIIAIMVAIAIPSIARYLRNYKIRGAANEVMGQLNGARYRAIMKNVNLGVIFVIRDANWSGWVVEDDLQPQTVPNWFTVAGEANGSWAALVADRVQMPLDFVRLPDGIQFVDPTTCAGGTAGTNWGLRFNRFGGQCAVASGCGGGVPPAVPGYPNLIGVLNGTATVCLYDARNELRRLITVSTGGRVQGAL